MPMFVIERNVPGASKLSRDELKAISSKSCDVVAGLGKPYKWVTSYVAGDKIYCLHEASDAETIREHARRGGFSCEVVAEVVAEFGPHTATELESKRAGATA